MTLQPTRNPLLADDTLDCVDLAELRSPVILDRPKRNAKRELLDLRRAASAQTAIASLTKANELYGFTKGQFSVLDLIKACLDRTGPARFSISTWTAARKEIVDLEALQAAGQITETRWLIDYTFARRDRSALHHIRKVFGSDSLRVANTHSKFCLFTNDRWRLVLRSSMNLNMNPRFEDFTLANDPEVADFLEAILDEIWTKQARSWADKAKPGENLRSFLADF